MGVRLVAASSHHLTLVNHADLRPTGAFSIGIWLNTSITGTFKSVFQSFNYASNILAGFDLLITSGNKIKLQSYKNTGEVENTDYKFAESTTSITDGNWRHLMGTWDGSNLKMYVNAVLEATTAWANAPAYQATNYVRVGGRYSDLAGAAYPLDAQIAELKLWNGNALTTDQIATEMRSIGPRFYLSNCKLYLPFDNATLPTTYTDFSSNSHPATPINTPTAAQHCPF